MNPGWMFTFTLTYLLCKCSDNKYNGQQRSRDTPEEKEGQAGVGELL